MKTTESIDIKDYKVNTRILFKYKSTIGTVFEGIILEFSDSGEYVCIQAPDLKIHWHKVNEIQVVDTLQNKAVEEFKDQLVKESIEFAKKHDLYEKPKETLKEQKIEKPHYEVYPNYKTNEPTQAYFLEIYNGKTWKLCLRNSFSVPKFGWSGHPYTLGEGEITDESRIDMYTLRNLKRIVDGLNLLCGYSSVCS